MLSINFIQFKPGSLGCKNRFVDQTEKESERKNRDSAISTFRRHFMLGDCVRTLAETDFRGKLKPPTEEAVLKIKRYAKRLTQGYSAYGGSS